MLPDCVGDGLRRESFVVVFASEFNDIACVYFRVITREPLFCALARRRQLMCIPANRRAVLESVRNCKVLPCQGRAFARLSIHLALLRGPAMPARDLSRSNFHFLYGNSENTGESLYVIVANFFSDYCQLLSRYEPIEGNLVGLLFHIIS